MFLQGLEKRGDNNLRKRIYMSAVTPDLYRPMYGAKMVAFFDGLLDPKFAGKPFMRHCLDYYWDIYWDLPLGVKGDAIPPQVRTIGESFNTVLVFRDPTQPIVYDNYMTVRALLSFLRNWIDERLDDLAKGRITNPERTIAWYWLKNAGVQPSSDANSCTLAGLATTNSAFSTISPPAQSRAPIPAPSRSVSAALP